MKKIRNNIFETNSSSTHTITIGRGLGKDYAPFGDTLKIRFIDTNDEGCLSTLSDKVSYLVSHIISWYKYDTEDYEDLIRQVKDNYDFRRLENYIAERYNKKIVFPKEYKGDIEYIVSINHQLVSWNRSLDEVIDDMTTGIECKFDKVLEDGKNIDFGRD